MPKIYTIDSYAQPRKSVQIAMPPPLAKRQQSDPNSSGGQSSELPTRNGPEWLLALWDWSSEKWANLQEKLLICRKKNGQMSIRDKIHPRYLEFEPLCCLSSCLVREGCYSVAAFEVFHFVFTTFLIAMKIYDGGNMNFWDDLDEWNLNAIVTHQFFLYILLLFNLVTLGMAVALSFGLATFERVFIKIHWRFDFVSLAFNFIVFILYSFALSSDGPQTWGWANVFLMLAIAAHIPVQIWAIFVVKSCYDFFVLLYVFVSLAEK